MRKNLFVGTGPRLPALPPAPYRSLIQNGIYVIGI